MSPLSRRAVLAVGAGATAALGVGTLRASPAYATLPQPAIHPRADWARGLAPVSGLSREAEGDVRFLIVHHSESPNTDTVDAIPGRLRSFFGFHTGTKKWPDVAYNFFVDPFGGIWEGRTGSLAGPVRGDATGGSQGYAQLCCFVGDHGTRVPTDAAMTAMTGLLAWLADRYRIDLGAGRTIRFTSRGSNRWPKGAEVVTDPIVGHRDMSQTACPGDALYPLVRSRLLPDAQALLGRSGTASSTATPSPSGTAAPETSQAGSRTPRQAPTLAPPADAPTGMSAPTATTAPGTIERLGDLALPLGAGAAVLGAGVVAGAIVINRKG